MGAIAWLDGAQLVFWLLSIPVLFVGLAWCEGTCDAGDRFREWLTVLLGTAVLGTTAILALDRLALSWRPASILIRLLSLAVLVGLVVLDVVAVNRPPRALVVPAIWLTCSLLVPAILLARRPLRGTPERTGHRPSSR